MKTPLFLLCLLMAGHTFSQSNSSTTNPPGFSAIKESQLRHDLFTLAGDAMQGRRAGTPNELKAAAWVAEQARKAGLQPAGDDSTYFQFFSLRRTQVSPTSTIQINTSPLDMGKNAWVVSPIQSRIDAPVLWLKDAGDTAMDMKGKVVAMSLQPPVPLPAAGMSLWGFRYTYMALRQQSSRLKAHGAAAIILVTDATAEGSLGFVGNDFEEGGYQLEGNTGGGATNAIPVMIVRQSVADMLQQAGAQAHIDLSVDSYLYPSVNVVAKAPGTDPSLKNEYVLFSGHHDHDGVGTPDAGDSIWNGADDNATVSVALLAIGRAWVQHPAKRSALLVWHGAEERGLLGSRWYVAHPTVPKESIVAVINGDMIGRNNPDSAALLGVTSPHRNSTELTQAAFQTNRQYIHFNIDTSWDSPGHPEFWYYRSDHLPYARAGIPAIFFTTLLHPDYHTPRDEPQRIDMAKLTRMTKWMYATGWMIANTRQRPTIEAGFKLER